MTITGTPGNDSLTGTSGDDTFDLSQGGDDTAQGLGGDDLFIRGPHAQCRRRHRWRRRRRHDQAVRRLHRRERADLRRCDGDRQCQFLKLRAGNFNLTMDGTAMVRRAPVAKKVDGERADRVASAHLRRLGGGGRTCPRHRRSGQRRADGRQWPGHVPAQCAATTSVERRRRQYDTFQMERHAHGRRPDRRRRRPARYGAAAGLLFRRGRGDAWRQHDPRHRRDPGAGGSLLYADLQ